VIHVNVVKKMFKLAAVVIPLHVNAQKYVIVVIAVKILIAAKLNQTFPREFLFGGSIGSCD
jgi:hypothetical protein